MTVQAGVVLGTLTVPFIGTEHRLPFNKNGLVTVVFKYTCPYSFKIVDSQQTVPSILTLDFSTGHIVVPSTIANEDFPSAQLGDRPRLPAVPYFIKVYEPANEANIFKDIPFFLDINLNCGVDKVSFAQTLQTAAGTIIQSPNIGNIVFNFNKVTVAAPSLNQKCDVKPSGYFVVQRGFNTTALNTQWTPAKGDYDQNFVSIDASSDPSIFKLEFKTTGMNLIVTYDTATQTVCQLDLVSTHECTQIFDVYAGSYTGVIGKIATYTLTVKC